MLLPLILTVIVISYHSLPWTAEHGFLSNCSYKILHTINQEIIAFCSSQYKSKKVLASMVVNKTIFNHSFLAVRLNPVNYQRPLLLETSCCCLWYLFHVPAVYCYWFISWVLYLSNMITQSWAVLKCIATFRPWWELEVHV